MSTNFYTMNNVESNSSIPKHFDYLLLACGVDNRAYEILNKLDSLKISVDNVILFDFLERKEDIGKDNKYADAYFAYRKFKFNIIEIPSSLQDPSSCVSKLYKKLSHSESNRIGIDISCFTKPFFFLLMKILKTEYGTKSVIVFYTEPKSYLFPKGLYNTYRSSSGPLRIIELPGYTGLSKRSSIRLLVILLGFDGDLSREINEDVAPEKTVIVNGFPGYDPKFKDISLISNEKLIANVKDKPRYSRANNPFETYNLLESLKKDNDNTFMNIAPLGTKPMALGACLFAIHNPDVRIIYPMPQSYENITTDNCWNSWQYHIPLELSTK